MPKDFYQKYRNKRTVSKLRKLERTERFTPTLKLNFGKYKGKGYHNIPISYLKWLLKVLGPEDLELKSIIENSLKNRHEIKEKQKKENNKRKTFNKKRPRPY